MENVSRTYDGNTVCALCGTDTGYEGMWSQGCSACPKYLIVSRHPAAIAFIKKNVTWGSVATVMSQVTADDVKDAVVAGNLPFHLAVEAKAVWIVEFKGAAPRGAEYTLAEMEAAGAQIKAYHVSRA